MAQKKGYEGNIKFDVGATGLQAIGNAHVWGLTLAGDTVEITDFTTTGWKKFLATLKSWSVTGECYWEEGLDPDVQKELRDKVAGAAATIACYVDGTNGYYGEGIVTSWDVGAAVAGVITASFALQGSDILNYGIPA